MKPTFPYRPFILLALSLAAPRSWRAGVSALHARASRRTNQPLSRRLSAPFPLALVQTPWQGPLLEIFPERGKSLKSRSRWPERRPQPVVRGITPDLPPSPPLNFAPWPRPSLKCAIDNRLHRERPDHRCPQPDQTLRPRAGLRGVSFEVEEGEVFGLLGPNGAGKTSTVEILEGLRPARRRHRERLRPGSAS